MLYFCLAQPYVLFLINLLCIEELGQPAELTYAPHGHKVSHY
jgi:hypothetical protein